MWPQNEQTSLIFEQPDDWPQDILLFTESEYERKKAIGGVCAIIEEEGELLYTKEHA
jgi:hypothetical protein